MSGEYEAFFAAVSSEQPSGVDLEYDPEFARMEKAAKGTPEQVFGSTVVEAQPPDWEEVRDAACQLLQRSKDLRAAVYLAQAELYDRGLIQFRNALQIVDVFLNQFWESVYPQLDADDDDDPTIRINSLMALNDVGGVVRQLKITPIVWSRSVGRFSLLHVAVARGEAQPPAEWDAAPTTKQIDAAVRSCDPGELSAAYQATEDCLKYTRSIEQAFTERLGAGSGPNFDALNKELKNIAKLQKAWLEELQQDEPPPAAASPAAATGLTTVEGRQPQAAGREAAGREVAGREVAGGPLVIQSREDVIDALDRIIRWLERHEPSSPLPMLLRRAKRLSTMSFLDILRDISPGGIDQALMIGGQEAEEELAGAKSSESRSAAAREAAPRSAPPASRVADDEY